MSCGEDGIIDIKDLTTAEVEGTGNFDEVMRAVKAHINEQYESDRITGSNYSTVYLGALTQALETTSMFTLQAPKVTQEIRLLEEQVKHAERNTALIEAQIRNLNADTNIKIKQLELMEAEKLGTFAGTLLTNAKTDETKCNLFVMDSTVKVNTAQVGKITAETGFTNQQCKTNIQQEKLLTCQQSLTAENTNLTRQKGITECAQTTTMVGDMCYQGSCCGWDQWSRGGILGAQYALLYKQKEGFDRDAQSKMAKLMTDVYSVNTSVLGEEKPGDKGLGAQATKEVIDAARRGIYLPPSNTSP